MMGDITTAGHHPEAIVETVARKRYAWPGGYELAVVTDDGGVICQRCVRDNEDEMMDAYPGDGWYAEAFTHTGENDELTCDHCYRDLMDDDTEDTNG